MATQAAAKKEYPSEKIDPYSTGTTQTNDVNRPGLFSVWAKMCQLNPIAKITPESIPASMPDANGINISRLLAFYRVLWRIGKPKAVGFTCGS